MANYNSAFLSNEFRVTDEERLKDILCRLILEDSLQFYTETFNGETRYHFGSYSGFEGYESDKVKRMLNSGELSRDDDMYLNYINNEGDQWQKDIQKILPENEACIVVMIGHEKLRYLDADAIIITKYDIAYKSLWEIAVDTANTLTNVEMDRHVPE